MAPFRTPICWGVMKVPGGYRGYSIPRTGRKGNIEGRVFHGPVCQSYTEAIVHVAAAINAQEKS